MCDCSTCTIQKELMPGQIEKFIKRGLFTVWLPHHKQSSVIQDDHLLAARVYRRGEFFHLLQGYALFSGPENPLVYGSDWRHLREILKSRRWNKRHRFASAQDRI